MQAEGQGKGRAMATIKSNGLPDWGDKDVFTTGEAAEICKVSQQTIIRNFDRGALKGYRVPGSRFRRIPRENLIRFMRANDIPTAILESRTRRVLVVDDDPQILELLMDALGRDDRFDVRTASTGYDAGLLTESFKPNLILLDYMLPDVNGNLVCERVRSNPAMQHVKILFCSGVVNEEEIAALTRSGADGFVHKPFDLEDLVGRMATLLELA